MTALAAPGQFPGSTRSALPYFALGTFGALALAGLATVVVLVGIVMFALWGGHPDRGGTPEAGRAASVGDVRQASPELGARHPPSGNAPAAVPTTPSQPGGFDPRRFDPWAYYPTAERMARATFADAKLVRLEMRGINAQGIIDTTVSAGMLPSGAEYRFFSPEAAKPEPEAPDNAAPSGECLYYVSVARTGISGRAVKSIGIQETVIHVPRCSPQQIWSKARARGAPDGNLIGDLSYYGFMGSRARWWVKIGSFGTAGAGNWIEDDC